MDILIPKIRDAPAIKCLERGYVVLALDMYIQSWFEWSEDFPVGSRFGTFWIYSQYDTANYMASGIIRRRMKRAMHIWRSTDVLSGFSTLVALYMDENSINTNKYRINICWNYGRTPDYSMLLRLSQDELHSSIWNRTVGMIAGHYDEFFFNKSEEEKTAKWKESNGYGYL